MNVENVNILYDVFVNMPSIVNIAAVNPIYLNTNNIDKFTQDFKVENIGREDKVKSFPSEDILKNISKKKGRFIKAPRII